MLAVELVEPINVAILPLVFLSLGAATAVRLRPAKVEEETFAPLVSRQVSDDPPNRARAKRPYAGVTTAVAVLLALFLGVTMVVGDAYLFSGTNSSSGQPYNLAAAKDASRLLPYWPDSAIEVAQIEAYDTTAGGPTDRATLLDSRHWTAVALGRDPRDPRIWTLQARADVALKAYGLARADYYQALSCDRWYTQALGGLGELAGLQSHWKDAVHWYRLALETVVLDHVDAAVLRGLLERAELNARSTGR
jgi:hypothetical protein